MVDGKQVVKVKFLDFLRKGYQYLNDNRMLVILIAGVALAIFLLIMRPEPMNFPTEGQSLDRVEREIAILHKNLERINLLSEKKVKEIENIDTAYDSVIDVINSLVCEREKRETAAGK